MRTKLKFEIFADPRLRTYALRFEIKEFIFMILILYIVFLLTSLFESIDRSFNVCQHLKNNHFNEFLQL